MHTWLVFLHVTGGFSFMLAHGVSAAVAFRLRREDSVEGIKSLATVSATSFPIMYLSLLILLASGIAAGFSGHYWGKIWIWLAIALLILITVGMSFTGNRGITTVRKAAGLPYFEGRGEKPPLDPLSDDEIVSQAQNISPWPSTIIGMGGLLVIVWLMIFKPF